MAENVVETIFVKLGLDGSSYNKDAEKAIRNNDKLNKSVDKTDKVVGKVAKSMQSWLVGLASATGVLKLVSDVAKLNDELGFLEKNLNLSSTTIKAWQGAAGAMGGTADGMTSSMKSLSKSMVDFKMRGDTSMLPAMNALGVSMVDAQGKIRKTDDLMLDLADSFSKIDRQQALSLSQDLGIDEGTFNTLVQGRKEMEKMIEYQKTMYQSSEKELEASRELQKNRALLGSQWESIKTMMANAVIPLFVKLSEVALGIFEYLQKHEREVKLFFTSLTFAIGVGLIPVLIKASIATIAFIAPFAPFIAVVAALGAAFGLLYDDYKAWAEGGKSLFDWGLFTNYINSATLSTENLRASFGSLVRDLINDTIPTLKGYADIVMMLARGDFKGAGKLGMEMITNFSNRVTGYVDQALGQEQGTLSNTIGKGIANILGGGGYGGETSAPAPTSKGNSKNLEAKGGKGVKAEFVQKYLPVAQNVGAQLGVPPEALLGQWALETGWGRSITKGTGFNLGNIKAGSSWRGDTVRAYDKMEKSNDKYRVYETPEQFATDYVKLIKGRKAYSEAIGASTPEEYFRGLKKGGYATDPKYVQSGVSVTEAVRKELRVAPSAVSSPSDAFASMRQNTAAPFATGGKGTGTSIKNDVNISNVNINTTSATMSGTGQDFARGVGNQVGMLMPVGH